MKIKVLLLTVLVLSIPFFAMGSIPEFARHIDGSWAKETLRDLSAETENVYNHNIKPLVKEGFAFIGSHPLETGISILLLWMAFFILKIMVKVFKWGLISASLVAGGVLILSLL